MAIIVTLNLDVSSLKIKHIFKPPVVVSCYENNVNHYLTFV